MRKREIAAALALAVAVVPVTSAVAQTPPLITTGGLPIGLESIFTGMSGPPIAFDIAPADASGRLFIAGQTTGRVELFKNGGLQGTPFLNVTTAGVALNAGGEKGLLGIAFHPNFAAPAGTPGSGKFYTFTSENKAASVDFSHPELGDVTGTAGDCDSVIREWTVSSANPDVVNTALGSREIMRIRKPQANHNGGNIRFGPDGYLYIGLGDGGGGNDNNGSFTDPTDGHTNNTGNAQDLGVSPPNVYGKMLRIDPRDPSTTTGSADPISTNGKYRIPQTNPFVGPTAGTDEIFAYGLRNPWRFSFDRVGGGLYVADVGQSQREEIDLLSNGGNFGWVNMEGTRVNTTAIAQVAPIGEYTHSDGQAVIGGYVYRGSNIPELYGKYIFGELGVGSPSKGRLFYMNAAGGTITEFTYSFNSPPGQLYSFGEDKDGELYALFANGTVARLLGRQWLAQSGGTWATGANWLGGIPNAAGASANFLGRITANATINLDGSKSVGFLRFNHSTANYTIAPGTGGSLSIDNGASSGLIQVIRGSHTIATPVNVVSNVDLDLAATTTLTLTSAAPLTISSGKTLTKKSAGVANIASIQGSSGALAIQDGSIVLTPGAATSKIANITVTAAGKLDVTNHKLVLTSAAVGTWNGSNYTGVTGLIRSGYHNGDFLGSGIVTSQSSATGGNTLTSVGVASNADLGFSTFGGVSVAPSDTLVMYTYRGDANLDGVINGDDYFQIDSAFPSGGHGWLNGDFNYDGLINGDDYFVIDSNFAAQGPPIPSVMPVPEPTGIVLLLPAALLGRTCRRRRSRLR